MQVRGPESCRLSLDRAILALFHNPQAWFHITADVFMEILSKLRSMTPAELVLSLRWAVFPHGAKMAQIHTSKLLKSKPIIAPSFWRVSGRKSRSRGCFLHSQLSVFLSSFFVQNDHIMKHQHLAFFLFTFLPAPFSLLIANESSAKSWEGRAKQLRKEAGAEDVIQKAEKQHEEVIKPAFEHKDVSGKVILCEKASKCAFFSDEKKTVQLIEKYNPWVIARAWEARWKDYQKAMDELLQLPDSELAKALPELVEATTLAEDKGGAPKEKKACETKKNRFCSEQQPRFKGDFSDLLGFPKALIDGIANKNWSVETKQLALETFWNSVLATAECVSGELITLMAAQAFVKQACELKQLSELKCKLVDSAKEKVMKLNEKSIATEMNFSSVKAARKTLKEWKANADATNMLAQEFVKLVKEIRN